MQVNNKKQLTGDTPADGQGPALPSIGDGQPIPRPSQTGPAQVFTEPPSKPDRLSAWLLLAVCLALACPALLVHLDHPDVVTPTEARTLATSSQSWHRQSVTEEVGPFLFEPFVPYLNSEPQLDRPPGVHWLHMAAFSLPQPNVELSTDRQVLRARMVSATIGLLTVASVYWAGVSIGGVLTGLFAALVCIANPVFVYYSRSASVPIYDTGLMALSMAAALWALRPLKPAPSLARQATGWAVCGVVLGLALLVTGPTALPHVSVPILLIIVLCPHRISHTMGLLAALLIGVLMALPWAAYVQGWAPDVWTQWVNELIPTRSSQGMAWYQAMGMFALLIVLVTLPWTLWLIGAIVQPFSVSSAGSRTRLFLGWVWFASMATMLVLFSNADQLGKMMVILPAFSVLIGQLFHQYKTLAAEGRYARFWQLLRWPHVALLVLASLAMPVLLYIQPDMGWFPRPITNDLGWLFVAGLGIVLMFTAGLSARWAFKQHPGRVLICWSAWVMLWVWMLIVPVTDGPMMRSPIRNDAHQLAKLATVHPVYWLRGSIQDQSHPDPVLTLYFGRPIEPVTPQQLDAMIAEKEPCLVLSTPKDRAWGEEAGLKPVSRLSSAGLTVFGTVMPDHLKK